MHSSVASGAVVLLALGASIAPARQQDGIRAKKISGQIIASDYNGTRVGCLNSDFAVVTDDAACDTFTAEERPPYSDEGPGHQYRLTNSQDWGCSWRKSNDQHEMSCHEGWKGGGWHQWHRQEPKDGGLIATLAFGFDAPADCEAIPLRFSEKKRYLNVGMNLNWSIKDGKRPATTPAPKLAATCTETVTATPISTAPPRPTDIPFQYHRWGQMHVYQGETQKGCLLDDGSWTLDTDACASYYVYNRADETMMLKTRGSWWCSNKTPGVKHFVCGEYDLSPELESQGWYLLNAKENTTDWHAAGMPEGTDGTAISMTEGDVDVQVKWWTIPS